MRRNGEIAEWHDRNISAGTNWKASIDRHLDSSEVVLLLVSADFLNSAYCYDVEMKRALQRHEQGKARVVPIILRDCDWRSAPFASLQVLPTDAVPIRDWPDQDKAFHSIVAEIRKVVSELRSATSTERRAGVRPTMKRALLGIAALLVVVAGVLGGYRAGMFGQQSSKAGQPPSSGSQESTANLDSPAGPETIVLYGSVVDTSRNDLPGVTIRLVDMPNIAATESSTPYGRFIIEGVPKKSEWIRIEASKEGYATKTEFYPVGLIPLEIMLRKE